MIQKIFIFFIIIIPTCLGFWQIERLKWKNDLLQTLEIRLRSDAVPYQDTLADFSLTTLTGHYLSDRALYLNSKMHEGKLGYHLYAPFKTERGELIWINRGWIPQHINPKKIIVSTGTITVKGFIHPTSPKGFFRPSNPNEIGSLNSWYWLDLLSLNALTNLNAPNHFYLALNQSNSNAEYPIPDHTHLDLPNNHLGYAITWFGLAIAALIIGFLSLRKKT